MSIMADDDEFIDTYMTIEPAGDNVPEDFYKMLGKLKKANGISNELMLVDSAEHFAQTNMDYISLSNDYMAHGLPENYHGFTEKRISEDLLFVIQHEIGHLNIHPKGLGDWIHLLHSVCGPI